MTVCYYHVTYEFQSEFTLYRLNECHGTPCSKQPPYLKFKWQQRETNPQPLSLWTNTQPFSQTGQMIELCCKYLSIWCIWLYVIFASHTGFRVNLHSIVCVNVKELLAWSRRHIWSLFDSNRIPTHNHLVYRRTLNHLAKLVKWLSCVVSTYLYGAFDCMFLSCHVRALEWIHTLQTLFVYNLYLFAYELSGCEFKSRCCHLNFR